MSGAQPEERVTAPLLLQKWRDVVFVHWPVAPEPLVDMLPAGLSVDTFEGQAWLTLTPLRVEGSRPPLVPPLRGVSNFVENNVRSYVVGPDGRDGLWFFTLETNSLSTVVAANVALGVPYRWASAAFGRQGARVSYRTRRRLADPAPHQSVTVEPHEPGDLADVDLAFWLTGRWRAWSATGGRLVAVPVEHEPWPLSPATLVEQRGTLLESLGLEPLAASPLVHWSPGVDARFGRPRFTAPR